jgi:hypothetical protein
MGVSFLDHAELLMMMQNLGIQVYCPCSINAPLMLEGICRPIMYQATKAP